MKVVFTRCAACGSDRVIMDSKKEGYSIGKGIVGNAIFGFGGAVMGLDGVKHIYYHCPDCGQVLSYSMHHIEIDYINALMLDTEKNQHHLEELKKKYPNITWKEVKKEKEYSDDDLADMICGYFLKNQINCIEKEQIKKFIEKEISKEVDLYNAIAKLRKQGIVTYEKVGETQFLNFYTNIEDIHYNISKFNYYSRNSFLVSKHFDNKELEVNIFQEKYIDTEFSIDEFEKKVAEYILERGYILKNGVNDKICTHFLGLLKDTYRIEIDKEKNKVFVHNFQKSKDLLDEHYKKKEETKNKKIEDFCLKILEILNKEDVLTVKITLGKYSDLFDEPDEEILKAAFEKLVKENKIYMYKSGYFEAYSLTKIPGDVEDKSDFSRKFQAIEWMLEEKNAEQAKKWNLVEIVTQNEPIKISKIYEILGIDIGDYKGRTYIIKILNYYIYVEKSIEKIEDDYYIYGNYEKLMKEKKKKNAKEVEDKYNNVVNKYKSCSNLIKLNEYITILTSLENYKDSKKIIKELNNKINEIKIKQEEEKKKVDEVKSKEKEFKSKKTKRILKIIFLVIILHITFQIITFMHVFTTSKEENEIRELLTTSITNISENKLDKLPKSLQETWKKYIPYCGTFQYTEENGYNIEILSDFKIKHNGEIYWAVRNVEGDMFTKSDYPFQILVNKNTISFFSTYETKINNDKIVDNKGKDGYIEANIEFKEDTIIYTAGYYETTHSDGKKENYNEILRYVLKKKNKMMQY